METIITFLASFLIWILFAGLFVLWVVDGKIKKEQVLHALFSLILAWAVAEIIKALFPTTRPFVTNGEFPLTLTVPGGASFPSGHTAAAFGLAVSIWLHDKKVGLFYILGAVLIGVARILSNVHYPVDIIGGAIIGSLTAAVIEKFHPKTIDF